MFQDLEVGETYTFVIDNDGYRFEADMEVKTQVTESTDNFMVRMITSTYPHDNWDGDSFTINMRTGTVDSNNNFDIGFVVGME